MGFFVKPEVVRLTVLGDQYIDVKKRLSHGEQEDLFAHMAPTMTPGEKVQLQSQHVRTAEVVAYLVGWSLTDDDGRPVPYSVDQPEQARLDLIRNLDPDVFEAMKDALRAHVQAVDAEYAAKKKLLPGIWRSVG